MLGVSFAFTVVLNELGVLFAFGPAQIVTVLAVMTWAFHILYVFLFFSPVPFLYSEIQTIFPLKGCIQIVIVNNDSVHLYSSACAMSIAKF